MVGFLAITGGIRICYWCFGNVTGWEADTSKDMVKSVKQISLGEGRALAPVCLQLDF